jgi:orotidine-5'-phosphate decarboxylase
LKEESRLILALDETRKGKALEVAEEVSDLVAAIKINWPLVLSTAPDIIDELSRISDVICDFKVADIPNTNRLIVEQTVARGAKGIIVHGFTGSDSVRAAVEAAGDVEVFVVVEMSHPGGKEFTQGASERIAKIAKESGAAGVIAPATRPERIREIRSMIGELKILSPGVGAQGGSAADAISMGADFVIVGRAIYQADSPRSAAERMHEEARMAWANRPD